ncbi:MAG: methyltransferase domain-containing protein [Nanoarchaeota archaeon]
MKITNHPKSEEDKYIFTEKIDYSKTEKTSIWGTGDKDTLTFLEKIKINGKWLNLSAGDGRYNLNLLEKADSVVASDIDNSALDKLWQNTPDTFKPKLKTEVFDITQTFPFKDSSFDGVFCTGTLHLFPKEMLRHIFLEIDRILKPQGEIIMDFATDIKRLLPESQLYLKKSEPQYTLKEAEKFLKELLKEYKVQIVESKVPEEEIKIQNVVYKFSCKFILLNADKK